MSIDSAFFGAIIGAGVTGFIGIIQIVLSRKALENSNRPYITIYKETMSLDALTEYLVIKNSGNTPAKIQDIIFDETKLYLMSYKNEESDSFPTTLNNSIKYLRNSILAPRQCYKIPFSNGKANFDTLNFKLIYSGSTRKKYKENITLNLNQDCEIPYAKSTKGDIVENALLELLRRI